MDTKRVIVISAAIVLDDQHRLLLVRKQGSDYFMQPGGKIDAGETPERALHRELREELSVTLRSVQYIGTYRAPAANEADHVVCAELFWAMLEGNVRIAAEIEESRWVSREDAGRLRLAPLTRDVVLPLVGQRIASSSCT